MPKIELYQVAYPLLFVSSLEQGSFGRYSFSAAIHTEGKQYEVAGERYPQ